MSVACSFSLAAERNVHEEIPSQQNMIEQGLGRLKSPALLGTNSTTTIYRV